jgi:DNA repair protein SbcC/Rad50
VKVDKLIIENVASLKGKHVIDFKKITKENNLFAITGATGSGKSTILNSISLGLYGKLYKKSLNQKDLVTLGEVEGRVDLYFSLGASEYLVQWICRVRQKNGKLLKKAETPPRKLFKLVNNEYEIIDKQVEEIINLEYEQFCKTTILNQGEFSRFLTSSFTERKSILERLYASDYLGRLTPLLRGEINDLNKVTESINDKIDLLSPLSEEEFKALKLELSKHKELKTPIAEILHISSKIKDELKDNNSLISKNGQNSIKAKNYKKNIIEVTNHKNLKAQEVIQSQKELTKIENEYKEKLPELQEAIKLMASSEALKQTRKNNRDRENKIEEQIVNEAELKKKHLAQKMSKEELRKEFNHKLIGTNTDGIKDKEIELLVKDYELYQLKIEKADFQIKTLREETKYSNSKIEQYKKEIDTSKLQLKNIERDNPLIKEDHHLVAKQLKENKDEILKELTQVHSLKERINENLKAIVLSKEGLKQLQKEIKDKKSLLDTLNDNLSQAQQLKEQNQAFEWAKYFIDKSLKTKSCLICERDTSEKDVSELLQKKYSSKSITSKKVDLSKVTKDISDLQNTLSKMDFDKEAKTCLMTKLKEQNNNSIYSINGFKIREYLNLELTGSETEIDQIITLTQKQLTKIEEQLSKIEVTTKEAERLRLTLKHKEEQIAEQENKLSFSKNKLNQFTNEHALMTNKAQVISISIMNYFPEYKDLNLVDSFKSDSKIVNQLDILTVEICAAVEQIQLLDKNIVKDHKEIELIKLEDVELEKRQQEKAHNIQRLTQGRDPNLILKNFDEKTSKLKDILKGHESVYQKLRNELSSLEGNLEQIIQQKNQIANSYQSRHLKILELCDQLNQNLAHNKLISQTAHGQTLSKITNKLANLNDIAEIDQVLFNEGLELFIEACKKIDESYSNVSNTIIELKTQLEEENKRLKQKQLLTKEHGSISEQLLIKNELYQLIGKDEFRNYVLGQIERNLLRQTNFELKQLYNARYELIQLGSPRPEYFIIDKYKGGLERKVATLSGGETFMVSLAMALALAEMTRGSTVIDSFFIDEGFGTLDKDSLEDVIEVLNGLKEKGKIIGIISHISELTSRINLNINLIKSQAGDSTIDYIYN